MQNKAYIAASKPVNDIIKLLLLDSNNSAIFVVELCVIPPVHDPFLLILVFTILVAEVLMAPQSSNEGSFSYFVFVLTTLSFFHNTVNITVCVSFLFSALKSLY